MLKFQREGKTFATEREMVKSERKQGCEVRIESGDALHGADVRLRITATWTGDAHDARS